MNVFLKRNWAKRINLNDNEGFFCGRTDDLTNLESFLLNNDNGSVLLSGLRGVGKTSFIYKVLNNLKANLKQKILVPVFIDANRINISDDSDIIKLIIRRLYSAIEKNKNYSIEKLYKKTQGVYSFTEESSGTHSSEQTSEFTCTFDFKIFSTMVTFVIGITTSVVNNAIISLCGKILLGISTCISLTPIITKKAFKKNKDQATKEIYQTDNSKDNLECELFDCLFQISKKDKIVFIIDELDKLELDNQKKIIKKLKNLFTLSCANYIFITDQNFYQSIINLKREKNVEATLFSHFVFLADPSYTDIKGYIEEITDYIEINNTKIKLKESIVEESEYKLFVDYLLFVSRFDFYELKKNINGICKYDKTNSPYINLEDISETDSKITIFEKALLSQIIAGVLEVYNYHNILNQYKNQNNNNKIFDFFEENFYQDIKYDIKTNIVTLLEKVNTNGVAQSVLDSDEHHLYAIFETMLRHSLLKYSGAPEQATYTWVQNMHQEYFVIEMNELLPIEQDFVNAFELFVKTINVIDSLYLRNLSLIDSREIVNDNTSKITGVNGIGVYNQYLDSYKKLTSCIPKHVVFDTLTKQMDDINAKLSTLSNNVLHIGAELLNKLIDANEMQLSHIQNNQSLLTTASFLRNTFANQPHFVLHTKDLSKQILIIKDIDVKGKFKPEYLKLLDEQKSVIFLCNIITNKELLNQQLKYEYTVKLSNNKEKIVRGEIKENYFEIPFNNDFMVFRSVADKIDDTFLS